MNSFPEHMNIQNIASFSTINNERVTSIFRQEIYETLLTRKDENVYIDLDIFRIKYCNNKTSILSEILRKIISELHGLGWKTKLSFGDTGLFIYSTDEPPVSCW
jgi:hypothetical protein